MKIILDHLTRTAQKHLEGFAEIFLRETYFADFIINAARGLIRHSKSWGWLVYDSGTGVFINDDRAEKIVFLYIEEMAKELLKSTVDLSDHERQDKVMKFACGILSAKGVKNIEWLLAKRDTVQADAFDRNPWMINCRGVAVDLRTGKQRPAEPDDLFMKCAGFKPLNCSLQEAVKQAPVFVKFIQDITCGRADLAEFHLRFLGYCLTGDMREKIFENHYGAAGNNGKSTETDTLKMIWGGYACEVPDSIVLKKRDEDKFDLAELAGIRLAIKSDVPRGQTLNPKIKEITGGDTGLNAQRKYRDPFTFSPQCKFIINSNDRLKLSEGGGSMESRIALLPYEASFKANPDKNMRKKLHAECPAILTILIEYARRWYEYGMPECPTVRQASREYIVDADIIASFIAERCFVGPGEMILKEQLLEAYNAWNDTGRKITKKAFKDAMASHGHKEIQAGRGEIRGKRCFEGIRLLRKDEDPQGILQELQENAIKTPVYHEPIYSLLYSLVSPIPNSVALVANGNRPY